MKHICTKFVAMLLVIAMIAGVLPFAFAARRPVHGCEGHRLVCFERSVRL